MNDEIFNKLKSLTILYAEDEDGIRKNIADSLRYYVKEVYEAKNGDEAYEIYKEKSPDIIISDIHMPKTNGIELVKKIRNKNRDIPVIMITAHTDKKYLLDAVELHMEKYIIKPIDLDKLLETLQKCIELLKINNEVYIKANPDYIYSYDTKTLKYKENLITLNKKEMDLLVFLIENQNRVVTYEELQEYIWGDDVMTDSAIRSIIFNLRKKLPTDIIKNLSGVGYRLE